MSWWATATVVGAAVSGFVPWTLIPVGTEMLVGALYVGTTVKTTIDTARWVRDWTKWAVYTKEEKEMIDPTWQWVDENPEDEIIIEYDS